MRLRSACEVKLGSIGIRPAVGHGKRSSLIVPQIVPYFILEFPSPDTVPSFSRARWIARLHHKPLDDAMKDGIVVISTRAQSEKVLQDQYNEQERKTGECKRTKPGMLLGILRRIVPLLYPRYPCEE